MKMIIKLCIYSILIIKVFAQEPTVVLNQGAVVGVKIYLKSSRVPIDAFLGIPYAAPPVGRLRFSAPEKHKGWKRTLYAQEPGPPCLQLGGLQRIVGKQRNEDCLYLNIWVPENAQRFGNLPVVLILHSESFSEDSPLPLPGEDLAAEGVVVVSANYRLNIFGFFCLGTPDARGNLGLLDQYFALLWIKENIGKFGGDAGLVTLLGHSAGATSVLYHMISPRTKSLFSRAILMSGSLVPLWTERNVQRSSKLIASILGCLSDIPKEIVLCLRDRTTEEILKAFKTQYQAGNWSDTMVPIVDTFLEKNDQYITLSPMEALSSGNFHQIPILTGLTSLEAANSREHWEELARQGYHQLKHYIDYTAIPNIMAFYKLNAGQNSHYIRELIKWEYVDKAKDGDAWDLLQQLQLLYSEAQYDSPYAKLIKYLVKTSQPLYIYKYIQVGGIDLYGKKSNTSGAAHGSDLPYLFGPTLFEQLARKRLTQQEERLSKRLKIMWSEFIKFGYPTPERQYDAWKAHTERDPHIQQIGEGGTIDLCRRSADYWNIFLPRLANITSNREGRDAFQDNQIGYDGNDTIRHAMYTLLGLVLALVVLLVICIVLLKKAAKERQTGRDLGTF